MMFFVLFLMLIALLVLAYLLWRYFCRSSPSESNGTGSNGAASSINDDRFGLELNASTGVVLDAVDDHKSAHGHLLATACDLAYLPEFDARRRYLEQTNLAARLISFDNTQAYVCQNSESIVVAFRGSERPSSLDGFKDWLLTNARNFLVLPEGRIGTDFAAAGVGARFHRGFMSALAEVWDPLYAAVDEAFKKQQRPIWITGHSLGGAIALLAAWRFHQQFLPVHRICTFGAPMIGNQAAADAYAREFPGKIIRYVDFSDMVPRLPATSLLNNSYNHVQREIILGGEGSTDGDGIANSLLARGVDVSDVTDEQPIDPATADGLWGNLHSGISAHLMGNYISRISDQLS